MKSFNWHASAQRQWDQRADFWNQSSQNMWDSGSRSTILPFFKTHVPYGVSVLDIGCGDGYGTYKLSKSGYIAYGLDLSEQMVQKAKQRGEGENLVFMQGDVNSLPFENAAFEAVLAVNCLEWTEHPLRALQEVKRVLKSNGLACIAILGPTAAPRSNSYRRLYMEPVICNTMMPWEFGNLAKENGFSVVDGIGVYKKEVQEQQLQGFPIELKQALTFLWIFMLKKL